MIRSRNVIHTNTLSTPYSYIINNTSVVAKSSSTTHRHIQAGKNTSISDANYIKIKFADLKFIVAMKRGENYLQETANISRLANLVLKDLRAFAKYNFT